MAGPSAAVFVVLGVVFRLGLTYTVIGEWISDRVEVSTPLNSWRRGDCRRLLSYLFVSQLTADWRLLTAASI